MKLGTMHISTNEVRNKFIDFFKKHDHHVMPSSDLVPQNDPTLMFTNAGMVQFKDIFTGLEESSYKRAVTSQKCVRAGGKHNDLDNVGYTLRHHTFFEMLGNFSFGDYFKEDAIDLAWSLITKEFNINKNNLLITVHSTDEDAAKIWKKVSSFSDSKIIRIPTSDNFWSMGDTGPCGPCSEIFYDHGEHIFGGPPGSKNEDGDRFVEIWNLVFMQFEQVSKDERINLPKPSVDTGMGLERVSALLNGTNDNFSIDIFKDLINEAAEIIKLDINGDFKNSYRVIADHIRAITFLVCDSVLPSNEGRGYVLRRIMRRAMRHAHLMSYRDPILYKLVNSVIKIYQPYYPELEHSQQLIIDTVYEEEIRFRTMLDRGIKLLDEETKQLKKGDQLPGEVAFKLYDTYGFPLDLTEDALRSKNMSVERKGFDSSMEKQKREARMSWSGSGDDKISKVWFDVKDEVPASEFLGYSHLVVRGKVSLMILGDELVKKVSTGDECFIVSNQTPFYAESGGQVGDTGFIHGANGTLLEVMDTQKKLDSIYVHYCLVKNGDLYQDEEIKFEVNIRRRENIARHHSATHLLHSALQEVLGSHVLQKGSLVSFDRLRFDISHPKAIKKEEIKQIEDIVNSQVRSNTRVNTKIMAPEDAIASGATALFGEKYGREVRVVSMGNKTKDSYSIELCGGTHVDNTGDIGLFKIINEVAVSSGVRRIEAVAGNVAEKWYETQISAINEVAEILKVSVREIPSRVKLLQIEKKKLEKDIVELRKKVISSSSRSSKNNEFEDVNGVKLFGKLLTDIPPKELKGFADEIKSSTKSGVIVLVSVAEEKVSIVITLTKDLVDVCDAVSLVKIASNIVGGKGGGGRVDMAQAGGPDITSAKEILPAVRAAISKLKN